MSDERTSAFEKAGAERGTRTGMLGECMAFLRHNRKWWLIPIAVVVLLFGILVMLASTGVAPFIYSLF